MLKHQKLILLKFALVIILTAVAVIAMVIFKDWVNRSEAQRAMKQLSQIVLRYKNANGSIHP